MAHLSCFSLKLNLASKPVEQWTSLVECYLDWHLCWGKAAVWPVQAIKQLFSMGWLWVAQSWGCGAGWTSSPLHWEFQRTSPGGMDSWQVCVRPIFLDIAGKHRMVCSHWDPLSGWPTWVALLVWKLDWLLDLGVVWLPVYWLCAVKACFAAATALLFHLLVSVAYTVVVGYGGGALHFSPRDLCGRHPRRL